MTHPIPAAPDRLLRLPQVREIVQRSRASIYRDVAQGRFPHP